MKNSTLMLVLLLIFGVFVLVGCQKPERLKYVPITVEPDYARPLPPGELALRKINDPRRMPDFTTACMDLSGLDAAVGYSLAYLSKPSSRRYFPYGNITHEQAVKSLQAFKELIRSGLSPAVMDGAIKQKFDVYESVGCDGYGTVLFTGYYTPILNASEKKTEQFKYPLYKTPGDLVKDNQGEVLGRRTASGGLEPYPPRAEIEDSAMLKGSELVWLGDEFEAYVAHVQGSAKLKMADGQMRTVGYAASNGREYKSVGQELVKDGLLSSKGLSLQAMIDFFKNNPYMVNKYICRNPRFIFFEYGGDDVRGSLNVPVTAMRTIATDKSVYPRACIGFITPQQKSRSAASALDFTGFVLDQDTGGAIRAPGRCDIYMGTGYHAGSLAGRTYEEGRIYYLFLK
ncbi:MAG: MltA domain-containing protein [Planctomycetota bacterium]